jgi:tetratricopeptide (TPR) repeat protein
MQQTPTPTQVQFRADWPTAQAAYAPVVGSNEELLKQGKLAEATQALLDAVPKEKRTAAHAFLLGNTLFDMEPAHAYALHEEAYAKAPDVPPVALEWAIELHRVGKWSEAEPLYLELLESEKPTDVSIVAALRSECLLRLGRPKDAAECWSKVNVAKDHIQVEKAACWIHNGRSPEAVRCELIAKVDAGDAEAADALILLDLDFARDWWNGGINTRYIEIDGARVAAKGGANSLRTQQTLLLAELMRARPDPMDFAPPDDLVAKPR